MDSHTSPVWKDESPAEILCVYTNMYRFGYICEVQDILSIETCPHWYSKTCWTQISEPDITS